MLLSKEFPLSYQSIPLEPCWTIECSILRFSVSVVTQSPPGSHVLAARGFQGRWEGGEGEGNNSQFCKYSPPARGEKGSGVFKPPAVQYLEKNIEKLHAIKIKLGYQTYKWQQSLSATIVKDKKKCFLILIDPKTKYNLNRWLFRGEGESYPKSRRYHCQAMCCLGKESSITQQGCSVT